MKYLNHKPLYSCTKQLYYDPDITFRILVKLIQGCGAGAPELGILPGAGAQINSQEPELSLEFRTGAMAIWELAPPLGPFLDTNGFAT